MRITINTSKVLSFEELSDASQERAIKEEQERRHLDDYSHDVVLEELQQGLAGFGITGIGWGTVQHAGEVRISAALGYCQGDGVDLEGTIDPATIHGFDPHAGIELYTDRRWTSGGDRVTRLAAPPVADHFGFAEGELEWTLRGRRAGEVRDLDTFGDCEGEAHCPAARTGYSWGERCSGCINRANSLESLAYTLADWADDLHRALAVTGYAAQECYECAECAWESLTWNEEEYDTADGWEERTPTPLQAAAGALESVRSLAALERADGLAAVARAEELEERATVLGLLSEELTSTLEVTGNGDDANVAIRVAILNVDGAASHAAAEAAGLRVKVGQHRTRAETFDSIGDRVGAALDTLS